MQNLLILYNDYYQNDVIKLHLDILKQDGKVAFGKIRPKSKDKEHKFPQTLQRIYQNTSPSNVLQLFLTNYASLFVAKVEAVQRQLGQVRAPNYYKEKNYAVEAWFIITDLCELERNDFITIRDAYLPNFTTPNYGNHTFRIYGNDYDYPLSIEMKQERNYFESPQKFYPNVFKSQEFLTLKNHLIALNFGDCAYKLHHASLDNIIYAELEFQGNKQDPLYDFSTITLKYSKVLEQEIYAFFKELVEFLASVDSGVLGLGYQVQSTTYILSDLKHHKPNLGTYKFILTQHKMRNLIANLPVPLKFFLSKTFVDTISTFQSIRNESAHGNKRASLDDAQQLRHQILGIKRTSILKAMIAFREDLKSTPPTPARHNTPGKPKEVFNGIRIINKG
ncbi:MULTISPECIES: HP0729 family protein [Helicobacter]|uniref:HP0729 family protein n=1 Tax=Helicobacter TaxID=209 RepID=UPI0019698B7F|nr:MULTISPECIES: HP0729 family protein [Helicobacter]